MILVKKISDQTRQRGHTLSTFTVFSWALGTLCPPPASLLFSRLSGLAATGPTLFCLRFSLVPLISSPFPTWRLQLLCGFLRFFVSLPPSPMLSSFPSPFPSSSPFPSPLLLSFPSPLPSPFPSCVRPRVSTPVPVHVPVPDLAPSPPRPCFYLAFLR